MAVGGVEVIDLGCVANEAITRFRFVKLTGAASRAVDMADTAGERVLGVAQHDVTTEQAADEAAVNVRLMGISTVEAGGTVTANGEVQVDATGRAIDAASGDRVVGIAFEGTTTAGDLITVALAGPAGQRITA